MGLKTNDYGWRDGCNLIVWAIVNVRMLFLEKSSIEGCSLGFLLEGNCHGFCSPGLDTLSDHVVLHAFLQIVDLLFNGSLLL